METENDIYYVVYNRDGTTDEYKNYTDIMSQMRNDLCIVRYVNNIPSNLFLPKDNPIKDQSPTIKNGHINFKYSVCYNKSICFEIPFEFLMKVAYITKDMMDIKIKNIESKTNKIILDEILCLEEIQTK